MARMTKKEHIRRMQKYAEGMPNYFNDLEELEGELENIANIAEDLATTVMGLWKYKGHFDTELGERAEETLRNLVSDIKLSLDLPAPETSEPLQVA